MLQLQVFALCGFAAAAAAKSPLDETGRLDGVYTLSGHSDEFGGAFKDGKWAKKLGDWIGTAPGAFDDDMATQKGGKLRLRARKAWQFLPDGVTDDCDCGFGNYKTGMVASKHTFKHGFFEIAATFPAEKMLSSFWLQGSRGEINVVEYSEGTTLASNYHCFDPDGTAEDTVEAPFDLMAALEGAGLDPADFTSSKRHVYGIDWTKDHVDYYIDGKFIHRVDTTTGPATCLVDDEMHVILSTEVTAALGLPNNGQPFNKMASFYYFRHWERAEAVLAPSSHSASSCGELGWVYNANPSWADKGVCGRAGFSNKKATKSATFNEAVEFCADKGARLCSADEVSGKVGFKNAKKSKPKMHNKFVWTNDDQACSSNKGLAVKSNNGQSRCFPKSNNRKAGIMCCADRIAAGQPMTGAAAGAASSSALIEAEDTKDEPPGTGTAVFVAGGLVAAVCLVGLVAAVIVTRNRRAAAAAGQPPIAAAAELDAEAGPQQRRLVSGLLSLPASRRGSEVEEARPIGVMTDLDTNNGFVLDQAGAGIRVASVRRENPMFRGSVYAPEDAVGAAGIDSAVMA